MLFLPVFVSSSNGNRHFLILSRRCFLCYIDSVTVTCTPESVIVYPCLQPLIFLDLLSDIVMAMQNKQTVLIVGAFSVGPCLRLL